MGVAVKDVRFVTRRGQERELLLYPRLLRDRSVLPKIDIAIQYFETMLGSERRELDTEVLVRFFGDHKIARCIIACLARGYRFRARQFEELIAPERVDALQQAGLDQPRALRLHLYDQLNDFGHGFLPLDQRGPLLERIEAALSLGAGELERLLYLDADEHAVLVRVGAEPSPEDVAAQYNFAVLAALLQYASLVELQLAGLSPAAAAQVQELALEHAVQVEVAPGRAAILQLSGRPDALGSYARHGRRLVRLLVELLERARAEALGGSALICLRDRRARLRLTAEVLDILAGAPAPASGWEAPAPTDPLEEALRLLRGSRAGWLIRRRPEPQAWRAGVVLPDALIRAPERQLYLCTVRSPGHGVRLAAMAPGLKSGEPYAFVGPEAAIAPLVAVGATALESDGDDPARLSRHLERLLNARSAPRQGPRAA